MNPHHVNDVLFSEQTIRQRVSALVREMAQECRDARHFVMIGILRGSFMFFADLVRELNREGVHARIDFMTLESYGSGTESSGRVRIAKDFSVDVRDCSVFIVDDILDTGRTLTFARDYLLVRGARSVRSCVLLDKPSRRVIPCQADYVGFVIDDHFVVGYGLDYDSYYRELPHIAKVTFLPPA